MEASSKPRVRKSAGERRDEIIAAAIRHFSVGGYTGTSTEAIARDAGISQPYLFRLFKTKRDLFLACHQVMHARILETFRAGAAGLPVEARLEAWARPTRSSSRTAPCSASRCSLLPPGADPVIQAQVRERYEQLIQWVGAETGATPDELWAFFGTGMLLNVVAALDLPAVTAEEAWHAITRSG
jgi:AcrR family transcriptional regulator